MGWMRDPGGVGTFDSNVRRPGPVQDGLNKWARKHIPEFARVAEGPGNETASGTQTPSSSQTEIGLENVAAAIEGWVKRLAIKSPGTPKGGERIEVQDLIGLFDGQGAMTEEGLN
jgi:hypothetical protein